MAIHLSTQKFGELVQEAIDTLPEEFTQYMENLSVEIQPQPTKEMLRREHVDCPVDELLGLYVGVPMTEKSVSAPFEWPERIFIFQRNIESICDSEDDVVEEVRHTVLHEVGHHFGMSEDDLDELGMG